MRPATLAAAILVPMLGCLPLAACGGGPAQELPQDFRPLDFSYLPVLHLNVGTVTVQDNASGSAGGLAAQAPEPPVEALTAMAHQRLIASGGNARATFSIDRASISADGDTLSGDLAVHLDIIGANGAHVGLAQAQVSRQFSGTGTSKAALYALTKQMMADMNVEFEYQVRRSLKDWLLTPGGTPVDSAVNTQTLGPPGMAMSPVVAPATTPSTITPSTVAPSAIVTAGRSGNGPTQLAPAAATTSPQPGYLVAPAGARVVTAPTAIQPAVSPPAGVIPPSTFDSPSNLPQPGKATANPVPDPTTWGY